MYIRKRPGQSTELFSFPYTLPLQVASELNAAILRAEHAESTQSKLGVMLKRLLWAQVMYNCLQFFFFFWPPPKKLEYKIPLHPLALREISDQLTWDLVL